LQELISDLPEHCIALMEDIDAAFHQTLNRDAPQEEESEQAKRPTGPAAQQDRTSRISLSGLLNALDGVGAQEGRLLFATTNRYEDLDPALRRPGRMDVHVEFMLASQYQVGELFKRFYLPTHRSSSKDDEDGDRKVSDSGYNTPAKAETEKLIDVESPSDARDQSLAAIARQRKHDVAIPLGELDTLMERFGGMVPEREFSMATLQGYLLTHKNRPHRAVECAGKWVEEEMAKKKAKKSLEK